MRFTAVVLACAASALGYTVLTPNAQAGWSDQGAQPLVWTQVSSDQANFTVVLTNNNRTLLPADQVLAALVVGSLGNTTLNPPSAGWPTAGTGYQINLVSNVTNLNQILAQSSNFVITHSNVTVSSTKTAPGSTNTAAPGSQPTDTTTKSGALSNLGAPLALAAVAAIIPAILA